MCRPWLPRGDPERDTGEQACVRHGQDEPRGEWPERLLRLEVRRDQVVLLDFDGLRHQLRSHAELAGQPYTEGASAAHHRGGNERVLRMVYRGVVADEAQDMAEQG